MTIVGDVILHSLECLQVEREGSVQVFRSKLGSHDLTIPHKSCLGFYFKPSASGTT
jgi:hypothetical protein